MNIVRTLPRRIDELSLLTRICELWREILGRAEITPDQHFFLAGGDSLQLARLLMRLQMEWGIELPLSQLWQFSTPRKMAQCSSVAIAEAQHQAIVTKMFDCSDFPASRSQQGLWFSELQADRCGLYHSGVVLELRGSLAIDALAQALNALRLQFPLLRGHLQPDASGRHLQMHIPPFISQTLPLGSLQQDALDLLAKQLLAEPFEMGSSLWRSRLYRHADDWHSLLLCSHHCLIDGWSGAVLLHQLALAYNAVLADPHWLPLERDTAFARHCWRQQLLLSSDAHADNLAWWRRYLGDLAPPPATLPWQASAECWPYRLQAHHWLIPAVELQVLLEVCASSHHTLFAALLTALALALGAVSANAEQVIAFPHATRTLADEENSIGCYMNMLPFRISLQSGETMEQLLSRVQHELTLVQTHAAPWQSLVQGLRPPAFADGNAWTEVVLALQNFPAAQSRFEGIECRTRHLDARYGQHLLKFELTPTNAGLCCRVDYAEEVLSADLVEQLVLGMTTNLQGFRLRSDRAGNTG